MIINVTFKAGDIINDAIESAVSQQPNQEDCTQKIETATEIKNCLEKWVRNGDIQIKFDTEQNTASVRTIRDLDEIAEFEECGYLKKRRDYKHPAM